MANIDEATRALQEAFDAKQTRLKYRPALAGDGGGTVDVADDPGFIWCRYSADQSKVSKVFNIIAPGIPEDFPILVGKRFPDAENEEVLFINWALYQRIITQETVDGFTTGNHGESHNAADGNDPAPIDLRNIIEMRGRAQATPDLTVFVEEGQFIFGDIVKRFISGSIDLTAAVPGVAGHRYVLVYVDGVTNALGSTNGTIVPLINTPPIPAVTANTIPICLAQLAQNQTTITEDDLFDWRFLWQLFSNQAPALIGTNAERLALTVADLAELTRFYTTDTDKIWDVWEGAWRLLFPPAALSESDGDADTPWTTDAGGKLTGSEDLILDDGSLDSPLLVFRGGSNDDEVFIFLDDDAVGGDSDLVISLVDAAGDSQLIINDSGGNAVITFDSDGGAVFNENAEDADLRVEGIGEANALFVQGSNGFVGIGTNTPAQQLEVNGGIYLLDSLNGSREVQIENTNAGNAARSGFRLISDAGIGSSFLFSLFGTNFATASLQRIVRLTHNDAAGEMRFFVNGADRITILPGGNVGVGPTVPTAKLHVDQASSTAAIPVLILDQADVSEEMIEFVSTIGVGNAIEAVGGKTLTVTHFIKITLPGALTRYIEVGTIA